MAFSPDPRSFGNRLVVVLAGCSATWRSIQNTEKLHKLSSPWEGPFTVSKVTGPGSYRLQTLEGEDVSNSRNIDQLCRFYA
jgi:hypothetical protein